MVCKAKTEEFPLQVTSLDDDKGCAYHCAERTRRRLRFGLISPYTGGNLGDAAIIESARAQLQRLFPTAELVLIVLDCERVSELHRMKSFPLTAVKRPFYFSHPRQGRGDVQNGKDIPGGESQDLTFSLKTTVKKIARHMPFAMNIARWVRDTAQALVSEMIHVRQANQVTRDLDGLIVAGGGQFDDEFGGPWGHPYAMFKWVSQASRRHVPVFFAGVGVCEISHSLTRWFLKHTVEKANRVSLRDEGSMETLRRLGITGELVSCPDLAFGLPVVDDANHTPAASGSPSHIGMSPIAYGMPGNWPTENLASFDRYWNEFKALGALLLRSGHRITLFATDDSDINLATKLYEHLMNGALDKEQLRILPALTLPELLTTLPTFDAVIAGRLHGILLSHISGVPALAISYHRKVHAHMVDIEQKKYSFDFMAFNASDAIELLNDVLRRKDSLVSHLHHICSDRYTAVEREFAIIGEELAANGNYGTTHRENDVLT